MSITTGDIDNDLQPEIYLAQIVKGSGGGNSALRMREIAFATDRFGLKSFLSTGAYSYVDLDNDGDLDIITRPATGPLLVYRNNVKDAHSIAFAVRDEIGNRFGIGTRCATSAREAASSPSTSSLPPSVSARSAA